MYMKNTAIISFRGKKRISEGENYWYWLEYIMGLCYMLWGYAVIGCRNRRGKVSHHISIYTPLPSFPIVSIYVTLYQEKKLPYGNTFFMVRLPGFPIEVHIIYIPITHPPPTSLSMGKTLLCMRGVVLALGFRNRVGVRKKRGGGGGG